MEEIPKSPTDCKLQEKKPGPQEVTPQDPKTGMAGLELSGELAKLLEQEVC